MNNEYNKKLDPIINKVVEKTSIPTEKYGSIIIALMIASIIISVIRVIQECNNKNTNLTTDNKYEQYGTQIKTLATRRGWFTVMRLKKIIRQKLSKEEYKLYATSIVKAMLDVAENLTEEEVYTIVEAANV